MKNSSERSHPAARSLPFLPPALLALLAPLLLTLGGCAYHLQGVVVEGNGGPPTIDVVGSGDSRLHDDGIRYATIELTVDPDAMHPNYMSPTRTDSHGHFSIPISETGAGLLMYKVQVFVNAEGYQGVADTIDLPSGFQRVVITLPTGHGTTKRHGDPVNETLEMERQLR